VNAGGLQIFGLAKNMASIRVAPFLGSIIMNRRGWNSIPEKYRPALMDTVRKMEAELDGSVQALEGEVIDTMRGYGLVINQLSPEQEQLWYADMEKTMPSLLGTIFDRDMYSRIESLLRPLREGRR
jgi:TRAP-type C4-dicarboxylate transport system substrate-binding protein